MYTVADRRAPEEKSEENNLHRKPSSSGMSHCFLLLRFLTALVCKVEKIKEIYRLNQKPGRRAAWINTSAKPTPFTTQDKGDFSEDKTALKQACRFYKTILLRGKVTQDYIC